MKFWEKFWKLVNKQYLIFGLVLFAFVIGTSLIESVNKVKVSFDEDAVNIHTSRFYSMNIPYDMVDSIELAQMPEPGENLKGKDDMTVRYGQWRNETWGEYVVCADLDATDCIVIHLDDGRIFVFSRRNNEATAEDFATFQSHLQQ